MTKLEDARRGIVDGKPLKDWIDAPAGAFAKTVREQVDPYYGLPEGDEPAPLMYRVRVRYSYIPEPEPEYASKTYEVEALSEEEAEEKARDMFDDDDSLEAGEDHTITDVDDPELI